MLLAVTVRTCACHSQIAPPRDVEKLPQAEVDLGVAKAPAS